VAYHPTSKGVWALQSSQGHAWLGQNRRASRSLTIEKRLATERSCLAPAKHSAASTREAYGKSRARSIDHGSRQELTTYDVRMYNPFG
jgi:hypothetical protein